jgi:hypothetical protein
MDTAYIAAIAAIYHARHASILLYGGDDISYCLNGPAFRNKGIDTSQIHPTALAYRAYLAYQASILQWIDYTPHLINDTPPAAWVEMPCIATSGTHPAMQTDYTSHSLNPATPVGWALILQY